MSDKLLSWKFAEEFVVERPDIAQARQHSLEVGVEPIAAVRWRPPRAARRSDRRPGTSSRSARASASAVCGCSCGAPDAVLTTIDAELDHQQHARRVFTEAGIPANHVRLIGGRAMDVLPRMNEASYDLVLVDADPGSVIEYIEHGLRLVRRGGTVVVPHALWRGRVADPAARDDITDGFRLLLREIAASDAVTAALSPVGDGLLQVTKLGE